MRLGMNLGIGQSGGPLGYVFEGQIERVQHRAAHRRNLGMGSAQPRFDIR